MKAAVRRHYELMQKSIVAYHGHVFKTVGDAFCAAFSTVPDALEAITEARTFLNDALTLTRMIGDDGQASVISTNLAEIEFLDGNQERA